MHASMKKRRDHDKFSLRLLFLLILSVSVRCSMNEPKMIAIEDLFDHELISAYSKSALKKTLYGFQSAKFAGTGSAAFAKSGNFQAESLPPTTQPIYLPPSPTLPPVLPSILQPSTLPTAFISSPQPTIHLPNTDSIISFVSNLQVQVASGVTTLDYNAQETLCATEKETLGLDSGHCQFISSHVISSTNNRPQSHLRGGKPQSTSSIVNSHLQGNPLPTTTIVAVTAYNISLTALPEFNNNGSAVFQFLSSKLTSQVNNGNFTSLLRKYSVRLNSTTTLAASCLAVETFNFTLHSYSPPPLLPNNSPSTSPSSSPTVTPTSSLTHSPSNSTIVLPTSNSEASDPLYTNPKIITAMVACGCLLVIIVFCIAKNAQEKRAPKKNSIANYSVEPGDAEEGNKDIANEDQEQDLYETVDGSKSSDYDYDGKEDEDLNMIHLNLSPLIAEPNRIIEDGETVFSFPSSSTELDNIHEQEEEKNSTDYSLNNHSKKNKHILFNHTLRSVSVDYPTLSDIYGIGSSSSNSSRGGEIFVDYGLVYNSELNEFSDSTIR